MSQYQNQYGAQTGMTDEYGNPVNQVDQYGNPISGGGFTGEAGRQHFGTTGGATDHGHGHGQQHRGVDQTTGYGTHTGGVGGYGTNPEYGNTNTGSGYGTGTGYGGSGTNEYVREDHHGDKKGVMDKIKEKIPGTEQSRTNTDGAGYGSTGYGASGGGIGNTGQEYVREEHRVDHGEKKGIMDKIKEKLPGTGGCTGH
ncbi:unnamed protein product [Lathyrus oleraceus]|uniref:Dehydrin DHN1 n=2 Tax=Pisum sativum TaxID=3888 RepID=DHN1_PEA|nr:dehydrin [Pisum sativum]P28639.1 RecName: Full=Dehydrin DHN1 [Pisum sativum]KAI5441783.1 Dehydrin dhn1, variant 3 [Pisum sativum]CAA44787.1 pea dehydrin DHN1 [Pisum sativum]